MQRKLTFYYYKRRWVQCTIKFQEARIAKFKAYQQTSYTNFSFCLFLQPQGLYDESAYRLLPAECWSPAGARLMTDEELQREYAVVLDALSCSLCSVGSIPAQMPTESSREQSCSGIQPPFYQNFHHQSSPAAQQTQHQTFCSGVVQAPGPYNHQLTVSESCVDEDEEDMSSWHGISGVPGLGKNLSWGTTNFCCHNLLSWVFSQNINDVIL